MTGDITRLKLSEFIESFNQQARTYFNGISDIDQLIKVVEEKEIVIKWEKGRFKNNIEYMVFSSPEASKAIVQYLKVDPPQSPDDFLFRNKGLKIKDNAVDKYMKWINRKLGITAKNKHKRINTRNLRKRFGSLLMKAEVNYRQAEYMLGHILPPVQGSYYKLLEEESMRIAYLKALPELMILEPLETRVLTDERLAEIEKEREEEKKEREREREQDREQMRKMQEEINRFNKIFEDEDRVGKLP
jgi:hypothetical protein